MHQALLFRQWSDDVTLFTHTGAGADRASRPSSWPPAASRVVDGEVASRGGRRRPARRRAAGRRHGRRPRGAGGGAADGRAGRRSWPRSGCGRSSTRPGVGEHVAADPTGRTEVPGVWVAGNVTDLSAQVGAAAAAGALAAAQINADLVAEDTRAAVAAHRDRSRRGRASWPPATGEPGG